MGVKNLYFGVILPQNTYCGLVFLPKFALFSNIKMPKICSFFINFRAFAFRFSQLFGIFLFFLPKRVSQGRPSKKFYILGPSLYSKIQFWPHIIIYLPPNFQLFPKSVPLGHLLNFSSSYKIGKVAVTLASAVTIVFHKTSFCECTFDFHIANCECTLVVCLFMALAQVMLPPPF